MHLPSGTRMCLLLAFAFLLITTEYPEFSRVRGPVSGGRNVKAPNSIHAEDSDAAAAAGVLEAAYDEAQGPYGSESLGVADLPETTNIGYRSTILVEAWGYRRWGGYGGGWGYRRRWGYGGGWGYRRRCCWGKRRR